MSERSAVSTPSPVMDRWSAWDSFLEMTPDAGFMQASWWADFRAVTGFEHFGAVLKSEGVILGDAMVLRLSHDSGSCFYYIQDGPVLPRDDEVAGEIFEATLAVIDEHHKADPRTVSHLRIEPRWPNRPEFVSGFRIAPRDIYVEPRRSLWIDLRSSEEEILAQMKPKGRYNIRVAQKHGVSIVEDASEQGLADFIGLYRETASRFFGGSLRTHRHLMAPYLLHFEIMRRCKAMGHEWYDLWGIAPENDPDHPWQNITSFKRKFGGVDVDLPPTLDYVYDAAAYDRYLAGER